MFERLRADVVSALRSLRSRPATAAGAVLTLAIAAGINLAIFDLIDRALLSPPARVVNPGRVFSLAFQHSSPDGRPIRMTTTSYVTFESIRDGVPSGAASAWRRLSAGAIVDGEQIQTEALLVSGSYFSMLEVPPRIGRTLLPDDDRPPSGSPVAVLSHAFWAKTFAADEHVIGRRIALQGTAFEIVGVMPAAFSGHAAARVDLWLPIHAAMDPASGWDRNPYRNVVEVGLRVGTDQNAAAAATRATTAAGFPVILSPIAGTRIAAAEQRIAYWLAAVSLLVLAIGLANTATLFLVRVARRQRELAIRAALGATRGRLFSELLVEVAVVAVVAMSAAMALAAWFDEAVRRLLLPSLVQHSGMSGRAAGAAAFAGLCALIVGAGVAAAQLRTLRHVTSAAHGSRNSGWRAAALLLVQTSLTVVLLAGAGMFGRSLYTLAAQDLGMRMDGVLLVEFEQGFVPDQDRLFDSALNRIRALPGVALATPVGTLPFTGFNVPPFSVPGLDKPPTINGQLPFLIASTPELFKILELDVVEGRGFSAGDETGPPIAIVNETMARTIWPGGTALGRCFRIGFDPSFDPSAASGPPVPPLSAPCREIVGIVGDVRQRSVVPSGNEAGLMQYFLPFSQSRVAPPFADGGPRVYGLLVRVTAGMDTLEAPIRRLIANGRTDLPFLRVRPYIELIEPQLRPWRTGTALLILFSALALVVSAIGLYAVFAHSAGERRREMAIRIAIGAQPGGVLVMVLREAASLAAGGVIVGSVAAAIAGRWVRSMLFGTTASDPLVLGAAAAAMVIVAVAATFVPARTASHADPSALLRAE
jgi:putative ABC transport system permease protein